MDIITNKEKLELVGGARIVLMDKILELCPSFIDYSNEKEKALNNKEIDEVDLTKIMNDLDESLVEVIDKIKPYTDIYDCLKNIQDVLSRNIHM